MPPSEVQELLFRNCKNACIICFVFVSLLLDRAWKFIVRRNIVEIQAITLFITQYPCMFKIEAQSRSSLYIQKELQNYKTKIYNRVTTTIQVKIDTEVTIVRIFSHKTLRKWKKK